MLFLICCGRKGNRSMMRKAQGLSSDTGLFLSSAANWLCLEWPLSWPLWSWDDNTAPTFQVVTSLVYSTEQASQEGSSCRPSLVTSERRRKLKLKVLNIYAFIFYFHCYNCYVALHPTEIFPRSFSAVKVFGLQLPLLFWGAALPLMALLVWTQEDLPVTIAFVLLSSVFWELIWGEARVVILLVSAGILRASFASQKSCQ